MVHTNELDCSQYRADTAPRAGEEMVDEQEEGRGQGQPQALTVTGSTTRPLAVTVRFFPGTGGSGETWIESIRLSDAEARVSDERDKRRSGRTDGGRRAITHTASVGPPARRITKGNQQRYKSDIHELCVLTAVYPAPSSVGKGL